MDSKTCTKCGLDRPLDDYYWKREPGRKPRRYAHCKACHIAAYSKGRYANDEEFRERHKQYRRRYYKRHRDEAVTYARAYREANREEIKARERARERHKTQEKREYMRTYRAAWLAARKEAVAHLDGLNLSDLERRLGL